MGTDYSIAVIGAGEDLPRRLKAVGYGVYRFENRDALARFSGREFLDLIVDAEKAVAILPGGAALPLSPPPEKAIAGAILRLPVTEEFSRNLPLLILTVITACTAISLSVILKLTATWKKRCAVTLPGKNFRRSAP